MVKRSVLKEKDAISESDWNQARVDKWSAAHRRRCERSPVKEWLAARRQAGLELDPKKAEYSSCFGQTLDPYGIGPEMPPELFQTQRLWFVRSKGSDIWVEEADLPRATRKALQRISEKRRRRGRR